MSVERLADLLGACERVVAFTGAGISTESGIPDFRGPDGLWKTLDPNDFTIQKYVADPQHRRRVWRMRLDGAEVRHEPNAGHRALVALERLGILDCIVTQNIDGLHQDAGSTTVLEVHGNARQVKCLSCDERSPMEAVVERVRNGDDDPHCHCGGLLKSATISFGEAMPLDVMEQAYERMQSCAACLVVGSSLAVFPAADLPIEALRHGARLAIVNNEPTPMDDMADVVVHDGAGEVLTGAVELIGSKRR